MNHLLIFSCFFVLCLTATCDEVFARASTGRTTMRTTGRTGFTTGRPASSTASSSLKCVCSCCSGLFCKPVVLQSFVDSTCTTKACKEKCKVFEPKHCDHTVMGTNDAYCAV